MPARLLFAAASCGQRVCAAYQALGLRRLAPQPASRALPIPAPRPCALHQLAGEGLELLPGVLPLLEALAARQDVAVGLVTGNLEPIGWGARLVVGQGGRGQGCGLFG